MARFYEPTKRQIRGWARWVKSRPANVRAVAERFTPWELYRDKRNGQRMTIVSFGEHDDGSVTLTVTVSGTFNFTLFDRQVFGVNPDHLEPCELPSPDELTGSMLSGDEVTENIDALRAMVRPDVWELDEHGHAIRRVTH